MRLPLHGEGSFEAEAVRGATRSVEGRQHRLDDERGTVGADEGQSRFLIADHPHGELIEHHLIVGDAVAIELERLQLELHVKISVR